MAAVESLASLPSAQPHPPPPLPPPTNLVDIPPPSINLLVPGARCYRLSVQWHSFITVGLFPSHHFQPFIEITNGKRSLLLTGKQYDWLVFRLPTIIDAMIHDHMYSESVEGIGVLVKNSTMKKGLGYSVCQLKSGITSVTLSHEVLNSLRYLNPLVLLYYQQLSKPDTAQFVNNVLSGSSGRKGSGVNYHLLNHEIQFAISAITASRDEPSTSL